MAETFLSTTDLRAALADADFERPPAFVMNAHVTGLTVARALADAGVPVVALDHPEEGPNAVAPPSAAVSLAGAVTYPLDDREAFREDLAALAAAAGGDAVAFGCMDEWVHALAATRPDGVSLPFAPDRAEALLDKSSLYARAEDLGVPYPETYRLADHDPDDVADRLGFPLVLKPTRKREGEAVLGTNVVEAGDAETFRETVAAARDGGVDLLAQERVRRTPGRDHSLASYVPPSGDPLAVVGHVHARQPAGYGTACLVERTERPEIRERALAVVDDAGYHGISEAEFVHDADRDEFVLLDVNTRPWKWVGLPVAAGANLPLSAYRDTVDADVDVGAVADGGTAPATRWLSLRDYLALLASSSFPDALSAADWRALVSGAFEGSGALTTAVYRPSDPGPTARLLATEFGEAEYYCPC
jgi:predicted ATP-grasp superfamily ATP-dependent carboligase